MAAVVRESGAFGGLLYVLAPDDANALWLAMAAGVPQVIAAPWRRVAGSDAMPVADAVREGRLIWVAGQEEMARRYPRPALLLPYNFSLAAAPVASGTEVRGGLVLLWPGAHSPDLSPGERDAIEAGCQRLGGLLREAADRGEPLRPADRPRTLRPPAGRTPPPVKRRSCRLSSTGCRAGPAPWTCTGASRSSLRPPPRSSVPMRPPSRALCPGRRCRGWMCPRSRTATGPLW